MCVCRPCDVREGRTVGVKGAVDEDLAQDALPVPALAWEPCAGPPLLRFVVDYRKGGAFASKAVRFKPFSAWRRTGRESIVFSLQKALFYVSMSWEVRSLAQAYTYHESLLLLAGLLCSHNRICINPADSSGSTPTPRNRLVRGPGLSRRSPKPSAHRPACVPSARLA